MGDFLTEECLWINIDFKKTQTDVIFILCEYLEVEKETSFTGCDISCLSHIRRWLSTVIYKLDTFHYALAQFFGRKVHQLSLFVRLFRFLKVFLLQKIVKISFFFVKNVSEKIEIKKFNDERISCISWNSWMKVWSFTYIDIDKVCAEESQVQKYFI